MIDNEMNKYEQALSQYEFGLTDAMVEAKVEDLLREHLTENNTLAVKKFLLSSVELTSLRATDTDDSILALTESVNRMEDECPGLPHVAAICTYPSFAHIVSQSLEVEGVELTCVAGNFPSGQALLEVKTVETALALKDGATEIDMVMPVGRFLSEDYETMCDEIAELKAICGEGRLKVILETCLLPTMAHIHRASILCMYAGADFLKTSTGKEAGGATPQAVYVMCQAIRAYHQHTGIRIGLKPAGGIRSTRDALVFYTIVKEVLGKEWLSPTLFRIGASNLHQELIETLKKAEN